MDSPPRKQHQHHHPDEESQMMTSSQKFLPSAGSDSDSDDPYSSDHFRMYEFKVRRCTRSRSHDWTDCPFAHPGEKARRRDPRRHHYSGSVCPDYRRGGCGRGESCEFAHGVFECWLHPARYRTEACKDGKHCTRKVCFFAHSPRQLRILPASDDHPHHHHHHKLSPAKSYHRNHRTPNKPSTTSQCCLFCSACPHHHPHQSSSSPTSTLLGLSHLSPPLSPMSVTDLMEAMHLADAVNSPLSPVSAATALPWLDVSSLCDTDQPQFVLSPSTPATSSSPAAGKRYTANGIVGGFCDDRQLNGGGGYCSPSDPDLGWVNDLLM